MKLATIYNLFINSMNLKSNGTRIRPSSERILITADFDEPVLDSLTERFVTLLSKGRIPLTLFCTNESKKGKTCYSELNRIKEFAQRHNVTLEIASHSLRHERVGEKSPLDIISIIKDSVQSFKENGFSVCGYRAPYLSMEKMYQKILKELDEEGGILKYDSSTLFEGSLCISRIHDFFRLKSPHAVSNIWELPISCLDDFHLFRRQKKEERFVYGYWKRKVDISLRKYNYFLLLIHPNIIGHHVSLLEDFLGYCREKHPDACFSTCLELVDELNRMSKKGSWFGNEDM